MSGIFDSAEPPVGPFRSKTVAEPWEALADTIIDTVKERTADFLEDNAAAKEFLEERGKALAKAVWEYKMAPNDKKAEAKHEMDIIQQTIENKLAAIALHGQTETKNTFKEILNTAFNVVIKIAPALLSIA